MGQFSQFKGPLTKPGGKGKAIEKINLREIVSKTKPSTAIAIRSKPVSIEKTLESCERAMAEGFQRVCEAMAMIRTERLYRDAGFSDFGAYCEERLGFSRDQGDRFASGHFTLKTLGPKCRQMIGNLGQVRALAKVAPEDRDEAVMSAKRVGPLTATSITKAAPPSERKKKPKPVTIDVTPEPKPAIKNQIALDIAECLVCETETLCLVEGKVRYCGPCITAAFKARK